MFIPMRGGTLDFLVGAAVEIKVTRVVDCEQDIAHGVGQPHLRAAQALPLIVDLQTGHHVQNCLRGGEDCEAEESGDQQYTRQSFTH